MPLFVGDELGPYEILTRLGAGGMGEVWKARDTRLDRIVAVKIAQGNFDERFEREARAIAALNHPNICQIYDVGPNYLVMEYEDGAPTVSGQHTFQHFLIKPGDLSAAR
jgi:eukaryotic-like serine/threonine-protein kinase